MNRATVRSLEQLRVQLEMTIDDKYVPPSFVPADEMPYFKRDVPLPPNFYDLTTGIHQTTGEVDGFISNLKALKDLGESYLKTVRDLSLRKGQFDYVKKATSEAAKSYETALKALDRAASEMHDVRAVLERAVVERDRVAKGTGRTVYPKGKP